MKNISKVIQIVGTIAKYAGILIILGETFEFLQKRIAEKFPADETKSVTDAN